MMNLHPRTQPALHGLQIFAIASIALLAPERAGSQEPVFVADETGFKQNAAQLLGRFCIDCHGPDTQEGDFRVDKQLSAAMTDRAIAAEWAEVVDVLNSHEMPPEDSEQPQPKDVAKLVDWVTEQLTRAEQFNRSADVVIRRLNRQEYKNTIRDLIGIDFDISAFPEDAAAGGFDNNGAALSMSPLHVELYLESARKILDKAIMRLPKPAAIRWRFEPESGNSDRNRVKYGDNNAIVNGGNNPVQGSGRLVRFEQWDKKVGARDFRVPIAGPHIVRVRVGGHVPSREEVIAAAKKLVQERAKKEIAKNPDRADAIRKYLPTRLKHFEEEGYYDYGPPRIRVTVNQGGQPAVIGEADVTGGMRDGEMQSLEFPVEMGTDKSGISLEYAYSVPWHVENFVFQKSDDFPRPELLIDWFEIEGPVYPQWPPEPHARLLPKPIPSGESAQLRYATEILSRFIPRAYRRTVTTEELATKTRLYVEARKATGDFAEAIKVALTAILISPDFLYLAEPGPASEPLNDFEIASRLSYFLWSSMPHDPLLKLAAEGRLRNPKMRASVVDAMLKDPRSEALVSNFSGQWLGLREVGQNPPGDEWFPRYDLHLEQSCVRQSERLFAEVLHNDLSVNHFIDSNFEMLNERLARYYGIPGVRGDHFRRVPLDDSMHRGGVLTHVSVLTVTSNGTRTTPVRRGVWVMKNLLNTDPGLPVANAGEIAPKVPGIDKATVRQRLEIHRELPQCARCHDKIDPLGFALENFDAAGRWRERESTSKYGVRDNDPSIDASGQLPDGTTINGIDDLKKNLLARREKLHECLAEKFFAYALGREMTIVDQPEIERATGLMRSHHDDLRTLIKAIVTSDAFVKR